jgi:carbonic anhydrase/acetyltransferase-like protein (isoleucine patch superfamily)
MNPKLYVTLYIGKNVKIINNLYIVPTLKYSSCTIKNNVTIEGDVYITGEFSIGSNITIGNSCKFSRIKIQNGAAIGSHVSMKSVKMVYVEPYSKIPDYSKLSNNVGKPLIVGPEHKIIVSNNYTIYYNKYMADYYLYHSLGTLELSDAVKIFESNKEFKELMEKFDDNNWKKQYNRSLQPPGQL